MSTGACSASQTPASGSARRSAMMRAAPGVFARATSTRAKRPVARAAWT
jgi:hypothetical protein